MEILGFGRTVLLVTGLHRFAGAALMINTAAFTAVVGTHTTVIRPLEIYGTAKREGEIGGSRPYWRLG
jgi:hypothetical protein